MLELLQRNASENAEKQKFLTMLWSKTWQRIESWLWRNFKLKTRKTRSQCWSGGSTYCLLPRHYAVQSGRRILTILTNILLPSSEVINILAQVKHISSEHMKFKSKILPCPLLRDTVAFKLLIASSLLLKRHACTAVLKFWHSEIVPCAAFCFLGFWNQ